MGAMIWNIVLPSAPASALRTAYAPPGADRSQGYFRSPASDASASGASVVCAG
jgi:hypothetical protein